MRHSIYLLFSFFLILSACQTDPQSTPKEVADLILINGQVATMDDKYPSAEAIAIKGDRLLKIGTNQAIQSLADTNTKTIDLKGNFVMPGIIEGHGHFSSLGNGLMNLNFLRSKNWDDIIAQVAERAKTAKPGEWIIGRGWHQEKWDTPLDRNVLGYPYHDELSELTPNNPVLLGHASGHSVFANKKAMQIAGVSKETPNPSGGEIVRGTGGEAIGVFEETAMSTISDAYNEYLSTLSEEEKIAKWYKSIELVEEECLKKGITSFQDAGATFEELARYKKLAEEDKLDVRLWAMIGSKEKNLAENLSDFPVIDAGNHAFTCRSIKGYMDGALGSFGAWLLADYEEKPDFFGQNVTPIADIERIADLAAQHKLQYCVHAIGDRANREVLDIYENVFKKYSDQSDFRWRIEHAQHIDVADIPRFADLDVIASMQAIHCTSDSPYVIKRLGEKRAKESAYPWRSLLDAKVVVTNGTDAPVEDVDPLESFYASVTRKRVDNPTPFFPEQAMTRLEGLKAYTLSNAYAAFEENQKGSLEEGKLADITVLSNNLLTCKEEEIMSTEIRYTIVGGLIKYKNVQ